MVGSTAGLTYRIVARQLELKLDGLLETLKSPGWMSASPWVDLQATAVPVRLLLLQRRYAQELVYRGLWVVCLDLLRIVVLVLDVDVAALLLVWIFILEVVAVASQPDARQCFAARSLLVARVLHEIVVVGHFR